MQTAIVGDHVAPEVQRSRPEWTRAADVYALGSTLLLLVPADEEAADLRRLLTEVMAVTPEDRPTAEVLLERLEALEVEHRVDERKDEARREMWRLVGSHRHIPWFRAQMNKMQESLVAVALGFYRNPLQRYGVVADFLNQLTESNPRLHNSLWGLGMRTGSKHLRTLGALRNHHVHGHGNQNEEQRVLVRAFLALPEPEMRTEVAKGAETAARLAQLKALPELVERLVGPAAPPAQN